MLSPLGWLNAAAAVAVREIQRLLRTPQEIIVCGFLPIFWVLVVLAAARKRNCDSSPNRHCRQ